VTFLRDERGTHAQLADAACGVHCATIRILSGYSRAESRVTMANLMTRIANMFGIGRVTGWMIPAMRKKFSTRRRWRSPAPIVFWILVFLPVFPWGVTL
jgi:hypothetical protein